MPPQRLRTHSRFKTLPFDSLRKPESRRKDDVSSSTEICVALTATKRGLPRSRSAYSQKDCSIALNSYRTPQSGDALPPSEAQGIVMKHKHSRMNAKMSRSCAYSSTVYRDPKAAQGTSKTDCGGQMGGSPKSTRNSIWQGKPACWGRPGVQPQLPGPP